MQAGGDGFGWRITAEHMTFQDPGVFIPRHICKVSEIEETHWVKHTLRRKGECQSNWFWCYLGNTMIKIKIKDNVAMLLYAF